MSTRINKLVDKAVSDLVKKHSLAVENMTEEQVAEIIKQMIQSGDFMRNVYWDGRNERQSVTYIPYREVERLNKQIAELEANKYEHTQT